MQNDWVVNESLNKEFQFKKQYFESPILIKKFNNFENIKNDLINLIKNDKSFEKEIDTDAETINVSRSDYHNRFEFNRPWLHHSYQYIANNVLDLCNIFGFYGFNFDGIWCQQYNQSSYHGWHLHQGCNYSGVFYVELPKNSPKTEIFDTLNEKKYFLDMEEGDIAIFPSYLPHRSSENKSFAPKTIISFNINFAFPDFLQKKYSSNAWVENTLTMEKAFPQG